MECEICNKKLKEDERIVRILRGWIINEGIPSKDETIIEDEGFEVSLESYDYENMHETCFKKEMNK